MDILKKLEIDHHKALKIIEKLEKRTEDADNETADLVKELCEEVKLHAKSEERALYVMCAKKNIPLRDFTIEGKHEHHLIDEMLDELNETTPGDDGKFKAALKVVKDLLLHHAFEEEEKEIFPKIKKTFAADELDEMAKVMEEYKQKHASTVKRQVAEHNQTSMQ